MEVTQRGVHFVAAPESAARIVLSLSQSFVLDTSAVTWAKDLNAAVRVTRLRLHATSGVANLDFIQSAGASMADNGSSGPSVPVMGFKRTSVTPSGSDIDVSNSVPVDVTRAWEADAVRIDLSVVGTAPTTAWSIDLSLWLSGRIDYRL